MTVSLLLSELCESADDGLEHGWSVKRVQLVRAIGYAPYGAADFDACVTTASRKKGTDLTAWHDDWCATASHVHDLGATSAAAGASGAARSAFFRASNYFRTAGLFAMGSPHDSRLVNAHRLEVENFRAGADLLALLDRLVKGVMTKPTAGWALRRNLMAHSLTDPLE